MFEFVCILLKPCLLKPCFHVAGYFILHLYQQLATFGHNNMLSPSAQAIPVTYARCSFASPLAPRGPCVAVEQAQHNIYIYIYIYIIHTCIHACNYIYIYIYMYTYTHIYDIVYIYIYICIIVIHIIVLYCIVLYYIILYYTARPLRRRGAAYIKSHHTNKVETPICIYIYIYILYTHMYISLSLYIYICIYTYI